MSFRLFTPSGKFKKFRIKELKNGSLTALNEKHPDFETSPMIRHVVAELKRLNASSNSIHTKRQKVNELKSKLTGETKAAASNVELAELYLRDVINRRKTKKVSKTAARQYLMRALKALGSVSIQYGSEDEIQTALDAAYPDENPKQRQLAMYLNCLLKYLKRTDVTIQKYRLGVSVVKHVNFDEIPKLLTALDSITSREVNISAFKLMVQMAFYSGLRIGELFALERSDYDIVGNRIRVSKQIDTHNKQDVPKNRKSRTVVCFPEMKELYLNWIKSKHLVPFDVRIRAARILTQACKIAFPDEPTKWIVFHGCRHSFAIRCLEAGLPMEMIARQLGNSLKVCEHYYLGFAHTDVTLDQVSKLLSRSDV